MKEARDYLISKGIHFSQQRIVIMDYLMSHRTHPTAEEIYQALSPEMPTLSLTTVYNTLRLFAEQNAIQIISIEEKNARFDACMETHAHFQCTECGAIYDIELPTAAISGTFPCNPNLKDYIVNNTQIYHKGICPKCKTSVK